MRVALVHDWLTGMRGGERVLEGFVRLFPSAEIFTLLHVPGSVSAELEARPIHTSFVQRLPAAERNYRWYLPLFPWAIEQFDLSGFDLVISTSHCVAKGALTDPATPHLCYCHTPMRYAWDQFDEYFSAERNGRARYAVIRATMQWLRRWDRATAGRVDRFAANSGWVAERISRYYGRGSTVIAPPVDTDFFTPGRPPEEETGAPSDPYYLVASALTPYKRVEVVIDAFNQMRRHLIVAGTGPRAAELGRLAGPRVEMRGWVDREQLRGLYRGCRGLVLAAVEDAGIVPLEAMACGRPAIVLDCGGAPETVIDGRTGVLIHGDGPAAVIDAIDRADAVTFNSEEIRESVLRFGSERFRERLSAFVSDGLGGTLSNIPRSADTARPEPRQERPL